MIGERVALGIVPELGLASVIETHSQPTRVGIGGELIHAPAVDLLDLVVIAMEQAARLRADRNESIDAERLVQQIGRKSVIDFGAFGAVGFFYEVLHRWEKRVGMPLRINLDFGCSGRGDAVGVREKPELIVEAVVLEINDDNVLDIA